MKSVPAPRSFDDAPRVGEAEGIGRKRFGVIGAGEEAPAEACEEKRPFGIETRIRSACREIDFFPGRTVFGVHACEAAQGRIVEGGVCDG